MSPVAPMLSHKRTRMLRRPISCACSFLRTGAAAASLPYLGRERRCIPDGRCECLAEVMSIQALDDPRDYCVRGTAISMQRRRCTHIDAAIGHHIDLMCGLEQLHQ